MKKQIRLIIILTMTSIMMIGCGKEKVMGETEMAIQTESHSLEQDREDLTKEMSSLEITERESMTETPGQAETIPTEETGSTQTAQTEIQETEDAMYFATGMYEKDARAFAKEFVNYVVTGEKETAAKLIAYPRKVTVEKEEALVNNAEEFLVYYDKIFTESFCTFLKKAVEEDFFWKNGMIFFGNGAVWFAPTTDGTWIMTIQNEEGNAIRYEGKSGVQTE